jgi:hypothetical protein
MRKSIPLLSIALAVSTAAQAQDDCGCWTPNAQQIAAFEEKIATKAMPLGSLDRYARYYAGAVSRDLRFIQGNFVPLGGNETPGVHVVQGKMEPLQGEGCIGSFSPNIERVFFFDCVWTPSDSQIAELESLMRQQYVDNTRYGRHYAGVVEGDRRVIRGIFVKGFNMPPGIYVESAVKLPAIADRGCSVINLKFDPSNKKLDWRCNARR